MSFDFPLIRILSLGVVLVGLAGCKTSQLDWDLRHAGGTLNTSNAALAATGRRPDADPRGVISYPGYQVALARRGDKVADVAGRVGLPPEELARYNALQPDQTLRVGEVLALPRRVAEPVAGAGAISGAPIQTGNIDVTTLAAGAIDRASGSSAAQPSGWQTGAQPAITAPGVEPARHTVQRGETAFTIARSYNVSARALADWNGLDADMAVREGQVLMIPVAATPAAVATPDTSLPGAGSPTPVPPSASQPLPAQNEPAASAKPQGTPPSPDLGQQRTAASAALYAMPVNGRIIRSYAKGKNEGIDIEAPAGTTVQAAADGTVAVITKDTNQVLTLVIRNADNLLTVYAGIDTVTVAKGDHVTRGQSIAKVRAATPSFLHFEVRKGMDSQDPLPFLQ